MPNEELRQELAKAINKKSGMNHIFSCRSRRNFFLPPLTWKRMLLQRRLRSFMGIMLLTLLIIMRHEAYEAQEENEEYDEQCKNEYYEDAHILTDNLLNNLVKCRENLQEGTNIFNARFHVLEQIYRYQKKMAAAKVQSGFCL